MSIGPRLGYKEKLTFGVTLTSSSFSGGNVILNVKDVKVMDSVGPLDNTTRNCNGFKQNAPGLRDLKISGKMNKDDTDTLGLTVLMSAYINQTGIAVAATDLNGANGVAGNFMVAKAESDERNGEIVEIDFELAPWYAAPIPPFSV